MGIRRCAMVDLLCTPLSTVWRQTLTQSRDCTYA